MKTETNSEYVTRAALNTLIWLTDRSTNCHPLIFSDLAKVEDMLGEFMAPKNTEFSATKLAKLNKASRATVMARLEGFIWAKLGR